MKSLYNSSSADAWAPGSHRLSFIHEQVEILYTVKRKEQVRGITPAWLRRGCPPLSHLNCSWEAHSLVAPFSLLHICLSQARFSDRVEFLFNRMGLLGRICYQADNMSWKPIIRSFYFALQVLDLFPELPHKWHRLSFQTPRLSEFENKP
jgi:hypothetical protein